MVEPRRHLRNHQTSHLYPLIPLPAHHLHLLIHLLDHHPMAVSLLTHLLIAHPQPMAILLLDDQTCPDHLISIISIMVLVLT
jgi:hypothetical protein